jgi:hypothetical protein
MQAGDAHIARKLYGHESESKVSHVSRASRQK